MKHQSPPYQVIAVADAERPSLGYRVRQDQWCVQCPGRKHYDTPLNLDLTFTEAPNYLFDLVVRSIEPRHLKTRQELRIMVHQGRFQRAACAVRLAIAWAQLA